MPEACAHQTKVRYALVDDKDPVHLSAWDKGRFRDLSALASLPGRKTRANCPVRRFGSAGRSRVTWAVREVGSTAGAISATIPWTSMPAAGARTVQGIAEGDLQY